MGSLRKKTVTRPIPANAKLFTRDGEPFAKWKPRRGKSRNAPVVRRKDGTLGIRTEAATYTAKYRDGAGIVREVATGCRDKDAAASKLAELMRRAELVKSDVMTADQAAIAEHQKTMLADHVQTYVESLKSRNVNADRIKTTNSRLFEVADGCGFKRLADLNHDKVIAWLDRTVVAAGRSASVYNGYVAVWKAFGFWLAGKRMDGRKFHWNGDKRILKSPFGGLGLQDESEDRRRIARSLTEDELARLLETARLRPLRDALTIRTGRNKGKQLARVSDHRRAELERLGEERRLIYMTAVLTGLRANELRTLRVGDLSFGDVPFAKLRPENEKSRKGSTVPLRADLAGELRAWTNGKPSSELVFVVPAGFLRIMNRDLAAAGIPKKDADGCVIHVHGLRTTFGTHLSAAGVTPRVAQAAMRHSDIKLTMGTYVDARLLDTATAVESLPSLVAPTVAPKSGLGCHSVSKRDNFSGVDDVREKQQNPTKATAFAGINEVERRRFELPTSALRTQRSPN